MKPRSLKKQIDIQLPDAHTLPGRVVNREGEPVSQVCVRVVEYEGVNGLGYEGVLTDKDGCFILEDVPMQGELALGVYGERVSGKKYLVDWTQESQELEIAYCGCIYGRVVDGDTEYPISSFTVKLMNSQVDDGGGGGYSVTWARQGHGFTSPQGFFDTGREGLKIGGVFSVTVFADGYDPLTLDPVEVQTVSSQPDRTIFRLHPTSNIVGRVVDETGQPIVGASVTLLSQQERFESRSLASYTTDPQGVFVISGVGQNQYFSLLGLRRVWCYTYLGTPVGSPVYKFQENLVP
jgi:hypothetical protein